MIIPHESVMTIVPQIEGVSRPMVSKRLSPNLAGIQSSGASGHRRSRSKDDGRRVLPLESSLARRSPPIDDDRAPN